MTKNRLAAGIAALMLTAGSLVSTIASAHEALSPWNNKSTSPFLAVHTTPNLAAWVYVGWDQNGNWLNTTTAVSATPSSTYWIRTYDKCTSGFFGATTNLRQVSGPNLVVRGSAYCAFGIAQGRAGVSSTANGF